MSNNGNNVINIYIYKYKGIQIFLITRKNIITYFCNIMI